MYLSSKHQTPPSVDSQTVLVGNGLDCSLLALQLLQHLRLVAEYIYSHSRCTNTTSSTCYTLSLSPCPTTTSSYADQNHYHYSASATTSNKIKHITKHEHPWPPNTDLIRGHDLYHKERAQPNTSDILFLPPLWLQELGKHIMWYWACAGRMLELIEFRNEGYKAVGSSLCSFRYLLTCPSSLWVFSSRCWLLSALWLFGFLYFW